MRLLRLASALLFIPAIATSQPGGGQQQPRPDMDFKVDIPADDPRITHDLKPVILAAGRHGIPVAGIDRPPAAVATLAAKSTGPSSDSPAQPRVAKSTGTSSWPAGTESNGMPIRPPSLRPHGVDTP